MNFDVFATRPFERKLKKLSKKYISLKDDLDIMIEELSVNPVMGSPLGMNCFKIRMAITSKGEGKSGGARLIIHVKFTKSAVFLLEIYDKSEQADISETELKWMIKMLIN